MKSSARVRTCSFFGASLLARGAPEVPPDVFLIYHSHAGMPDLQLGICSWSPGLQNGTILIRGLISGRSRTAPQPSGPHNGHPWLPGLSGPSRASRNHSGPFWAVWGHLGPFRTSWSHSGPSWACWSHSGPFWACWNHSGPFWGLWGNSGPLWAFWSQSRPWTTSRSHAGPHTSRSHAHTHTHTHIYNYIYIYTYTCTHIYIDTYT